ncbi:5-formyltetrahydrofolate cyclo-ligase [Sulfitobacter sp. M57]|uniref:5-formyltetrahydrofolate cyclo-ligase n=1 Tax=unclassified Sulfitobacter TaxID=196795 RepID=UPI0023E2AAD0|nr:MULTISPECIES: 5-formyltetrahydrofolate cyclo-ligase [unclassified Sulfitobacter]MDF3414328.1 5-formyltetrahydrofolate cyclo-ligase [Sulfitobacter sp. KE5]MDF3420390.1 5-formyltetrahydrofolate cyclo-ligase [Sulfitobacter sp. KE43]MDF3432874.1 5-formyltetrahydrofolate cyclo-ligase [Sulfitobacter sp. KE42]MDF3458514.1 5-formyltetrahydrofolate cyclo-ligase [Sulfitobacter sp. S74]MDF3462414.1 5-formyltetrahydrofolate cyclo-ligase [Sulfitobacter sp. Ks18]
MNNLTEIKAAARKAAFVRRKPLFENANAAQSGYLSEVLAGYRGVPVSGFMPIRTEIDPTPAMAEAAAHGRVGVPVIEAAAQPLKFAEWVPDTPMVKGAFGAQIPETPRFFEPEILIVPLLAFNRAGGRLGYGGGFYDRTLELLRGKRPTLAIGFAFAGQEVDDLPLEATDQPLNLIVTETGVIEVK